MTGTEGEARRADPVLAVLGLTSSFARLWEEVAEAIDAELRVAGEIAELAPLRGACGVVVAAAGEEERASEGVGDARRAGAGEVVVVGASEDHRLAVALVGAGADDYFALPGDVEAFRAWATERAERARAGGRAEALAAEERERYDFSRFIGRSPAMVTALDRAARVIPRPSATVLITGETGTGKGLLAQAIHYNGPRAAEPFVEVNCTALPATLLEAELFGYEKGAFTDARAAKPGLFEAAHGGTLFLDEIGDLSRELQAKLLKVLEDRRVRRLGSVRDVEVDVRLVAATHVDIAEAVREGRFRDDLYYRLNVVPIHLPPLRDRPEDILLLAEHFLGRLAEEHDVPRPALTAADRHALVAHPWRGNVRELRNAIERAVLLGDGELRPDDLFEETTPATDSPIPFPATLDAIERAAARVMVERCDGNKSAAADALGISRSRLYRLLARAGGPSGGV